MTVLKTLAALLCRLSAVITRTKTGKAAPRLAHNGHHNDVSADAWNAFWVIGQGGPIPK